MIFISDPINRTVIIKGKKYKYNADTNWNKWKRIESKENLGFSDEIRWYDENVFIDKPPNDKTGLSIAKLLIKAIRKDLGMTDQQLNALMKNAGKLARGKAFVPGYQPEVIEFNVGHFFKGFITYADLKEIPFRKMLFWNKMIETRIDQENKKIEAEKQNVKQKGFRRSRTRR